MKDIQELYQNPTVKNCLETLHDGVNIREEATELFITGDLSLHERAWIERTYWHLMAKVKRVSSDLKYVPEEIEKLDDELKDTFFCNFSVFQSLPDSWAIDQLFPVMPIHRLKEQPTRRCTLADMSCDSDGKIEKFIDLKDVKNFLPVHPLRENEPYYLGIFLVGAYQEILGDLHNLFGDANSVIPMLLRVIPCARLWPMCSMI
jgi:arginine decarboxylase